MASKGSSWVGAGARAAAAKVRKWARRRIIVNPRYQYGTLLPLVVCTVAFAVLFGGLVLFPLYRELSTEPDLRIQVLLKEQLMSLQVRLWPMLLFASFLASVYALLRSHHVAGPLYRLSQVLQKMTEGDYRGVRFREGDEFREFETIASQLSKKMQALSTRSKDVLLSVESRVKQLVLRLNNEQLPSKDVQSALEGILAQLDKARERTPATR